MSLRDFWEYILNQFLKKLIRRSEFWLLWAVIGVLCDEYLKEGYWFRIQDLFTPNITHEKIILTLMISYISLKILKQRNPE